MLRCNGVDNTAELQSPTISMFAGRYTLKKCDAWQHCKTSIKVFSNTAELNVWLVVVELKLMRRYPFISGCIDCGAVDTQWLGDSFAADSFDETDSLLCEVK